MNLRIFPLPVALFLLLFGLTTLARADGEALEQLVDLFQKKALLSPAEVKMIRETLARDQARIQKKEKEIEEKERALSLKEEELQRKAEALEKKEQTSTEAGVNRVPGVAPSEPVGATSLEGGTASALKSPEKGISLKAAYQDGFCLAGSVEGQPFSLCLGGLVQTDYRYYDYVGGDPNKNKFDIRRARLILSGHLSSLLDYKFEYEFQGAGSRNLLDAYADLHVIPYTDMRFGQFKEPFGLEQYTKDKDIWFAERSIGFLLTPQRDVGVMAHASLWKDRVNYGVGLFNGDGLDDSVGGNVDEPQVTGRVVLAPFKNWGMAWGENFQVGGSFSYLRTDPNNMEIHLKTAGLTPFFDVASRAKFNIIRRLSDLSRYGAELGWGCGPFGLMAEYISADYNGIETSSEKFDANLEDYYVGLIWMVTGETPQFRKGILQPLKPRKSFGQGGWGAVGLAFRYDRFVADQSVYDYLIFEGNSVRAAKAYTITLNWYLNDFARFVFDATRTDFDRPLLISRDALTGTALYSDREDVFTARFQLGF